MRKFLGLLISCLTTTFLFVNCGASLASTISVHYTGTYTGTWYGNYDPTRGYGGPFNPPPDPGPTSGQFDVAPFSLMFNFDTSLAQPGFFNASHLGMPPFGNGSFPNFNFPSVGSASFLTGNGWPFFGYGGLSHYFGNYGASDDAGVGSTSQSATSLEQLTRYYILTGSSVQISASSPRIPSSILANYSITNGLTGSGEVQFRNVSTILRQSSFAFRLGPFADWSAD